MQIKRLQLAGSNPTPDRKQLSGGATGPVFFVFKKGRQAGRQARIIKKGVENGFRLKKLARRKQKQDMRRALENYTNIHLKYLTTASPEGMNAD